jgi:hypothetical protein
MALAPPAAPPRMASFFRVTRSGSLPGLRLGSFFQIGGSAYYARGKHPLCQRHPPVVLS